MHIHKLIASVAGIGYLKGGGTVAALTYCIIWFLLPAGYSSGYWQVVTTVLLVVIGVWSANDVESSWGKDSSKVVIDEVAGMAIALLFVQHTIFFAFCSLVLFRFFDIVKPLGIRHMEKWKSGWGVMADDVLAGMYALVVLHCLMVGYRLLE